MQERERLSPIYSTLEDDPDVQDFLHQFVVGLAETVDLLQDAELAGEYDTLQNLASALATRAAELGYRDMSEAAEGVCRACKEDKPEAAENALVALTDIGRRVRLGHRGAA